MSRGRHGHIFLYVLPPRLPSFQRRQNRRVADCRRIGVDQLRRDGNATRAAT